MKYFGIWIFFLTFYCISINAQDGLLPSYMSPCDYTSKNLPECMKEQMDKSLSTFSKGIPELNVPSLDPFQIRSIEIDHPNLKFKFTNIELHGLGKVKISDFKMSQDGPPFKYNFTFVGDITLTCEYTAEGEILVLPIKGDGKAVIDTTKIAIETYSSMEESGDSAKGYHYKLVNTNYKYKLEKAKFDFENLFKGNPELSQTILQVINDSWDQVMEELGQPVLNQIVKIVIVDINKFFAAVPNDRLFQNYKPGQPWGS